VLQLISKKEIAMKIHAFVILVLLGLAACTTTYKGSIKGTNNENEQKRERYISSQSEAVGYGSVVNK
jgi:hypothetical protein